MAWTMQDIPAQTGRTALVTGANSGLGLETSRGLAAAGAHVIMACRNQAKAEAAMQQIRAQQRDARLEFLGLDLSRLASVQAAAEQLAGAHEKLDLLVNNAGIMAVPYAQTEDGFEAQIGTNHFGHFALTGRLLPLLQAAGQARIVNVASLAHRWTPGIDFDDIDWTRRRYRRWQAYGDSKLANLYFTGELSRRLEGIRVTAAHPGYSSTHLQFVAAEQKNSVVEKLVMQLGNALMGQSAAMGALPSLYAASMDEVASGDYIGPDGFQQIRGYPRKVGMRRLARREDLAGRLWELSAARTGVAYP